MPVSPSKPVVGAPCSPPRRWRGTCSEGGKRGKRARSAEAQGTDVSGPNASAARGFGHRGSCAGHWRDTGTGRRRRVDVWSCRAHPSHLIIASVRIDSRRLASPRAGSSACAPSTSIAAPPAPPCSPCPAGRGMHPSSATRWPPARPASASSPTKKSVRCPPPPHIPSARRCRRACVARMRPWH